MASVVLAVAVFLLGVTVGRGVRGTLGEQPAITTGSADDDGARRRAAAHQSQTRRTRLQQAPAGAGAATAPPVEPPPAPPAEAPASEHAAQLPWRRLRRRPPPPRPRRRRSRRPPRPTCRRPAAPGSCRPARSRRGRPQTAWSPRCARSASPRSSSAGRAELPVSRSRRAVPRASPGRSHCRAHEVRGRCRRRRDAARLTVRPTFGRRSSAALLSALSGVLLALSFPKFGHPAFAWVALAPLFVACATTRDIGQRLPARLPRRLHRLSRHALLGRRRRCRLRRPADLRGGAGWRAAGHVPVPLSRVVRGLMVRRCGDSASPGSGWRRASGWRPNGCARRRSLRFPLGAARLVAGHGAAGRAAGERRRRLRSVALVALVSAAAAVVALSRDRASSARCDRRRVPAGPGHRVRGVARRARAR